MSRAWLNNYREALERVRKEDRNIKFAPWEPETDAEIWAEVRHDINISNREIEKWIEQ